MEKIKKLFSLFLTCFLLFSTVPVAAENRDSATDKYIFTLEEVKELALKNSRIIKSVQEGHRQAQSQKYIAANNYDRTKYGSWYGASNQKLSLIGSVSRKKEELRAIENRYGYDPNGNEEPPADWLKAKMEISGLEGQLGSATSGEAGAEASTKQLKKVLENSRDALKDTKRAREDTTQQVEYNVEKVYSNILVLEEQVSLLKKNSDHYAKLVEIEKVKRGKGLSSEVDYNKIHAQYKDNKNKYEQAKDNLYISKMVLNDMMGRPLEYNLKLTSFEVGPVIPHGDINDVTKTALEKAATMEQQKREVEDMKDDLDDLSDSNEEEVQKAQINQAKINLASTDVNIRNYVKQLFADLDAKEKSYKLKQSEVVTAEQEFTNEKKKFELGIMSSIQYQACELAYQEKLNAYKQVGYEYFLLKHKLELVNQGIILG